MHSDINILADTSNLFYIGGVVRDKILEKESFDIDLTYVGNAIEYAQTIKNAEILKINEPFGTVRVRIDGQETDIASTRSEIYERPGHLPIITQIGCSLKQDVLRRDFTINTLAQNYKTGEIIDYTGGLNDIKAGKIKVLHDKSFIEDPTRILRALKFSVRFGFGLDEHTKMLRDDYLKNINYDMSFKRLKKELIETFNLNLQKAYDEFMDNKIYKLVTQKEISKTGINIQKFITEYDRLIEHSNIWLIYLATISDLANLELTKEEKKIIKDFNSIENLSLNTDYEIYNTFKNLKTETIIIYGILKNESIARHYLNNLKNITISINGADLQRMGIKPSPVYQDCFDYILKQKLANKNLTSEDEISLAKKFLINNN